MGKHRIVRTLTIDDITPEELAAYFSEFDSEEQAEFFNELGLISRQWPGAGMCKQAYHIVDHLDRDGIMVVESLGNHHAAKNEWTPA